MDDCPIRGSVWSQGLWQQGSSQRHFQARQWRGQSQVTGVGASFDTATLDERSRHNCYCNMHATWCFCLWNVPYSSGFVCLDSTCKFSIKCFIILGFPSLFASMAVHVIPYVKQLLLTGASGKWTLVLQQF